MKRPFAAGFAALALLVPTLGLAAASSDLGASIGAARGHYDLAKRAIAGENYREAIAALEQAARLDPENPEFHNLLGLSYRMSGNLDKAFGHYRRALDLNPRHIATHEYIGRAYLMKGEPERAYEHYLLLEKYCPELCKEREMLRGAIAQYPWSPPLRTGRSY